MRLKRRKTRNARMSRKTLTPGRLSEIIETREIPTTRKSNQFHRSDQNSMKNVLAMLMQSSMMKTMLKNMPGRAVRGEEGQGRRKMRP